MTFYEGYDLIGIEVDALPDCSPRMTVASITEALEKIGPVFDRDETLVPGTGITVHLWYIGDQKEPIATRKHAMLSLQVDGAGWPCSQIELDKLIVEGQAKYDNSVAERAERNREFEESRTASRERNAQRQKDAEA